MTAYPFPTLGRFNASRLWSRHSDLNFLRALITLSANVISDRTHLKREASITPNGGEFMLFARQNSKIDFRCFACLYRFALYAYELI